MGSSVRGVISPGSRSGEGIVCVSERALGWVGVWACVDGVPSSRTSWGNAFVPSLEADDPRCRSRLGEVGTLVGWSWVLLNRSGLVVCASAVFTFCRVAVRLDGPSMPLNRLLR